MTVPGVAAHRVVMDTRDSWLHLPYFRHHSPSLSIVMSLINLKNFGCHVNVHTYVHSLSILTYAESYTLKNEKVAPLLQVYH